VADTEIGTMDTRREFLLPFGIELSVEGGSASIESHLPEALPSFYLTVAPDEQQDNVLGRVRARQGECPRDGGAN